MQFSILLCMLHPLAAIFEGRKYFPMIFQFPVIFLTYICFQSSTMIGFCVFEKPFQNTLLCYSKFTSKNNFAGQILLSGSICCIFPFQSYSPFLNSNFPKQKVLISLIFILHLCKLYITKPCIL